MALSSISCVLVVLGDTFDDFWLLGASKVHGFCSGLSGGVSELRECTSGRTTGLFQGAGLPGGTPELRERSSGRVTGLLKL